MFGSSSLVELLDVETSSPPKRDENEKADARAGAEASAVMKARTSTSVIFLLLSLIALNAECEVSDDCGGEGARIRYVSIPAVLRMKSDRDVLFLPRVPLLLVLRL